MDKGAHYFRCDFQVHTPRDVNWNGTRPVSDDERRAWAREFVKACREKALDAVAITDHHDFAMVRYVREAAAVEVGEDGQPLPKERRLVVFPGLELTLSVPCQALLILDSDYPTERLDAVLTRLAVAVVDPSMDRLPHVTAIDIALLSELYDELNKDSWLRGNYIIFPNVTDGGHQTLLRSHMHHKYKEMPCVGGYLDGTVETKVGEGNRKILGGLNQDYGNKRLALIQTSDSRSATYEDLGRHTTWIKWSVPTAEALRQACLAQESRIAHSRPGLPTIWVSRISVTNSMFLGPVELELNPQFNAIIGGRGTGKSTILDYLRWALCDIPASIDAEEEIGDPSARQRRLITSTLAPTDSMVEVHFKINEIPHVVRRNAKLGDLTLKVGDGDFAKVRDADVRELLPIQAYSQKQLSSVAVRIDELTRFVTSPIRRQLAVIDDELGEVSGKIRENYAALQRRRQLQASIERSILSERSLFEQAANLRASLDDVSDEDRSVLENKTRYDAARSVADGWQEAVTQALEATTRLDSTVAGLVVQLRPPTSPPEALGTALGDLQRHTIQVLASLQAALSGAVKVLREQTAEGSDFEIAYRAVADAVEAFDTEYVKVKERSTAHAAKLGELAEVEKQHRAAGQSLRSQRGELEAVGHPEAAHEQLMHSLFERMADRSSRLEEQCAALDGFSGGLLRGSLEKGRGLDAVSERFRGVVSGSGLRANKIEDFFQELAAETNPLDTWEVAVGELEALTQVGEDEQIASEAYPVLGRLGLRVADLKRIAARLDPEGWLALALTPVTDHPRFEYQTKEDVFIDFASASAGQQATALLRVLLAQPGPPLIIDQPEDDLDSEVVQNIVEEIWSAKQHRQLVFASHNANLVVNGDAELVVHCDYRVRGEQSLGEVAGQGAIDLPAIREAITRVMEGGEKAFKLRKEKYGF